MFGWMDSFVWCHRVETRCYRKGTLAFKASHRSELRRDSKSHLNAKTQPITRRSDFLVESGEFAKTQVQRPPDQISRIPRIYRLYVAKRTRQISHEEKPLQEGLCQW